MRRLPDTLLESELFGAERGSYTGSVGTRIGVFESADGGTIFLDEISNLPLPMQVKLLRVLQEREIRRIGGTAQIPVNVRVVAASNQELGECVRKGQFREDLYYRLNVVRIDIPPLRDRAGDVGLLAQHFVAELSARHGTAVRGVSSAALMFLERYGWPGNVRELRNVLERAILLSESNQVMPTDLPAELIEAPATRPAAGEFSAAKRRVIVAFEAAYLRSLLEQTERQHLACCGARRPPTDGVAPASAAARSAGRGLPPGIFVILTVAPARPFLAPRRTRTTVSRQRDAPSHPLRVLT